MPVTLARPLYSLIRLGEDIKLFVRISSRDSSTKNHETFKNLKRTNNKSLWKVQFSVYLPSLSTNCGNFNWKKTPSLQLDNKNIDNGLNLQQTLKLQYGLVKCNIKLDTQEFSS